MWTSSTPATAGTGCGSRLPGLERGWKLKAEFLSQRYTTRWGELLAV
ncbi:DUF4113 domain-containing protein [Methylobacterium indicum]